MQPELSALLDSLEQSACNPKIASIVSKSLLRILQLSPEKTIASFKTLNAVARVLKIACIQAQESKRVGNVGLCFDSNNAEEVLGCQAADSCPTAQSWLRCMETCMELFMEVFSITEDARHMILHNSTCIDYMFDLFWEEVLRNHVLKCILDLLKVMFSTKIQLIYDLIPMTQAVEAFIILYLFFCYILDCTIIRGRSKS